MQHELSHDAPEDGFHEIQLSGKQLVFLFMTVTTVSVFIFLCGVLVGRGARDIRGLESVGATVALEGAPQASPADAGTAASEPPSPAESADDETKPENFGYHDTLRGKEGEAEKLKGQPEPAAAAPPTARVEAAAAAPVQPPAVQAADVPTSGRPGTHIVQVFASKDRGVAASLVRDLKAKGYPAYLVLPEPTSPQPRFRVQVGRYSERDAAQASARLEREEKLKPWVTSAR